MHFCLSRHNCCTPLFHFVWICFCNFLTVSCIQCSPSFRPPFFFFRAIGSIFTFSTCVRCGNYRLLNRACPLKTHSPLTVQPFVKLTPFPPQLCSRQSQNSSPNLSQTAACVKLLSVTSLLPPFPPTFSVFLFQSRSSPSAQQRMCRQIKLALRACAQGGGLTKQNGKEHFWSGAGSRLPDKGLKLGGYNWSAFNR